jgi:arylsulfatase A-like enzyme
MSFNISHAEDGDRRPGYHFQWPAKEDGLFEDIEPLRPTLDDPKYYAATPEFLRKTINRGRCFWRWDTPGKYRINMRALYRMLAGMDRIVGRVVDTLQANGLAENTIVIYSADNGYYMGDRGFAGKWSHYDQAIHVPLIGCDPRMRPDLRGRVLDPTATSLDIPATILEIATDDEVLPHPPAVTRRAMHLALRCGFRAQHHPHRRGRHGLPHRAHRQVASQRASHGSRV